VAKKHPSHLVRHGVEFLILVVILAMSLGGLIYYRFDSASQIAIVLLMSVLYVFWGVVHHIFDNNLTSRVVLEYIGMSALVSTILITFLLRA
jgi:hypothetical protein